MILGPRLSEFLKAHPGLKLDLMTRDELGDMVADGFDLAIRFGEPRSSSMIARKLLDTRVLTVAAPSYLKRYGHPADPRALKDSDHVRIDFRNPETGRPFQWEFHRDGERFQLYSEGQLVTNDVGTMHFVCVAGYGIAQVMELGVEDLLASGRLVNLFPEWTDERFPLYALYPSRNHMPAKTSAFLNFVSSIAGNPR